LEVFQPIQLNPIQPKQENSMSRFPKIATSRPLASFRIAGAIAAVMVLSTMSSAWAADTPAAATPAPEQSATPASSGRVTPTGSHVSKPADLGRIVVNGYGGAVHAAGDAQWTDDDTSAPELPMARE
jgi:ABC-type uncharacterized transport system auxiliary subunit